MIHLFCVCSVSVEAVYSAGTLAMPRGGTGFGMCSQTAVTIAETSDKPASA
jgi:hypothetical protein